MRFFYQAVELLTQPPGDLVYFLVTLFALQLILVPALTAWRNAPQSTVFRRWVGAALGMLGVRGALIAVALFSTAARLSPTYVSPPLERWVEFASILLIIWAAILSYRPARWQPLLLTVLLVASLIFLGIDLAEWPALEATGIAYSQTGFDMVWSFLSMGLLGFMIVAAVLLRPLEWEWSIGIALFWLAGHIAHRAMPEAQLHTSGWLRLSALATWPLLVLLAQRQLLHPSTPVKRRESVGAIPSFQSIIQTIESARELDSALIIASSRLADLLDTDVCAIALTVEDKEPATVRVTAVHPPSAAQIETPELTLATYPSLEEAYREREPRIVAPGKDTPWLNDLFSLLGFRKAGHLLVMPLNYHGTDVGLLLLADHHSKARWNAENHSAEQVIAGAVAAAIVRAGQQELPLHKRRLAQDPERQKLEQIIEQAKEQIQKLNARIGVLSNEVKARDKEILRLTHELDTQPNVPATESEVFFWQNEVQELVQEREVFKNKLEEALQDRDVLIAERDRLAEQFAMAKAELSALQDERERVGTAHAAEAASSTASAESYGALSGAVGLLVVDEDGQITMADAPARKMLQLPQGDVVGIPVNGAYADPVWAQTVERLLSGQANNGTSRRAHLSLAVDDRVVEAELATLLGRDGKPDGLAITLRSSESDAVRQEAIASLASDIRTPMTAINGYTDLLLGEQAGILTEMQQQFLERVKANVEQMNHLLNDLVSITSPDVRPVEVSPSPVNLIEIIEEAVMGIAARFRERKLAVQLDLPPEAAWVRADRDSIYQIMLRLISNAALCSKQGTEVIISAREDTSDDTTGYVRISVTDTGGGIALEDQPKVFRRFYRANQPLIEGMGETGLGMAVAKTLVEANGGRIWVESQAGVGSTFSFVLPTS